MAVAEVLDQRSTKGESVPASWTPASRPRRRGPDRARDRRQRARTRCPTLKRSRSRSPKANASRVLPIPPGPGERHQRHVGPLDQAVNLVDRLLPPEQRCGGRGQRACRARAGARAAGGREPNAKQRREVVTHEPAELGRRAESPVGGLLLDPGEQLCERGSRSGAGDLHVQETRQRPRQLELVFQPGELHAGADLSIALPVQPDEDVALSQVRPVQLTWRVWPRTQLEHHRREPHRRNSTGYSPALISKLADGRAHEHSQTLVGRPNRRVVRQRVAHRSPRVRVPFRRTARELAGTGSRQRVRPPSDHGS